MGTLYESIVSLCDERGIKPGKMCNETNISRGLITDLKTGRKKSINTDTAQKIADYFGVSVDRVLGTEQKEKPSAQMSEELGDNKQKLLEMVKDMSDEEMSLLFDRIEKIKESRI